MVRDHNSEVQIVQSAEDRAVGQLEARVQPCDLDEAMLALKPMFRALPMADRSDLEGFINAFRLVVCDYPIWAVKEAVVAFMRGQVAEHKASFCPNVAEFGRELDRRVNPIREQLRRSMRLRDEAQSLRRDACPGKLSADLRELGRQRVEELRALSSTE